MTSHLTFWALVLLIPSPYGETVSQYGMYIPRRFIVVVGGILVLYSAIARLTGNIRIPAIVSTKNSGDALSAKNSGDAASTQPFLKVAIYMTTHLSQEHVEFLRNCWPAATKRLPLLQEADLILYTSGNVTDDLIRPLHFRTITIKHYHEALPLSPSASGPRAARREYRRKKQLGAVQAMTDPFQPQHHWFDGYDWVIRVNPDVLIRRDTWLHQTMRNTSIDAILIDYSAGQHRMLHSDFVCFRPSALNHTKHQQLLPVQKRIPRAERHMYQILADVVQSGRYAWLPNAQRDGDRARVLGPESDVIHYHPMREHCPDYFDATDGKFF